MGYWDLVEPWWDRISIYDGPAMFLAQFAEAPEASSHLFAAHFAASEIANGGISSSGIRQVSSSPRRSPDSGQLASTSSPINSAMP